MTKEEKRKKKKEYDKKRNWKEIKRIQNEKYPGYSRWTHLNSHTKKRNGVGWISYEDFAYLHHKFNVDLSSGTGMCAICGSIKKLTVDHIKEIRDGGTHNLDNLQLICLKCNMAKARFAKKMRYFIVDERKKNKKSTTITIINNGQLNLFNT